MSGPAKKHTPTPWHFNEHARGDYSGNIFALLGESQIRNIAVVLKYAGAEESRANAKLIVRAVNAHDDLVKALEEALPFLDNSDSPGGCDGKHSDCPHCQAIKSVRAALSRSAT